MINKKGFEFSFGWMFAIIVGAAIIFLAIYSAVRLVSTERGIEQTEAAKQLGIILTPAETELEEGKSMAPIVFPTETRVYNNCTNIGNFGEQLISVASSSGIGKKWTSPSLPVTLHNKYIFSEGVIEGKNAYLLSKPFSMPFKIANLIFIWNEKYCFVMAPTEIENEINELGLKNINYTDSVTKCERNSKKVCFAGGNSCDVFVSVQTQTVVKGGKDVYYEGPLLYGAIFSSPEIYECQVQRLMKRASEISLLYAAKSENIAALAGGCSSGMQEELREYAQKTSAIRQSSDIRNPNLNLRFFSDELKSANDNLICKLWEER